ncbi:MAG: 5'/3'-nucleotidase SurE [Candidatus Nitrohelix vancouverensis]|uniref:5'-nucleotidase SurE n=1 Tax=Candidatus Nitrohelix vancouverensis TaxID=2705534 RepID=A0A7T0G4J6_9BACT|nr:MAG: 5'/3'-nucleotidase SurE [Candidatus Nitrohelix vancouverensis]
MIILSNDDGFNAPGLRTLRKEIAKIAEVLIVAPETEQSAMGHAISISAPLKVREVVEDGERIGYAVNGTPADCVKMAVSVLLDEPPELVISGINLGGNLGTCVIYSGTVSAATEAAIMGVPAIAVSLDTFIDPDFSFAAEFVRGLVPQILDKKFPEGVALNINIPAVPKSEIRGLAITRQGKSRVIETFDKRKDPRNNVYYWLAGEMRFDEVEQDTDCEMVAEKYISITPIQFDLTRHQFIDELKDWNLKIEE